MIAAGRLAMMTRDGWIQERIQRKEDSPQEDDLRRRGVVTFGRFFSQFFFESSQFRIGNTNMETEIIFVPVFHGPQYLNILPEPFGKLLHHVRQSGPAALDRLQTGCGGIIIRLALVELGIAQQGGIGIE